MQFTFRSGDSFSFESVAMIFVQRLSWVAWSYYVMESAVFLTKSLKVS